MDIIFHPLYDHKDFPKNSFLNNKPSNNFPSNIIVVFIPWIKKQLDEHQPNLRTIGSNVVTIVADATFFGRISDRLGTLVFKDVMSGKIIAKKHIERENADDYKQLIDELIDKGFIIQGAVVVKLPKLTSSMNAVKPSGHERNKMHIGFIYKNYLERKRFKTFVFMILTLLEHQWSKKGTPNKP